MSDVRAAGDLHGAERLRLLIVDDEPEVRESVSRLMALEGYDVETASDGETALAAAIARGYDVILLDQKLPDIQGQEVVRRLRRKGLSVPVVIFTGFGNTEAAFEAAALGVFAYVDKPVAPFRLASILRTASFSSTRRPWVGSALFAPFPSAGGRLRDALGELLSIQDSFARGVAFLTAFDARLARLFARLLCEQELTICQFSAAAACLRYTLDRGSNLAEPEVAQMVAWLDEATTHSSQHSDRRVTHVLMRLEHLPRVWCSREAEFAAELDLDRSALWRLLEHDLGMSFLRCRTVVTIRRALVELIRSREHIRQIAFRLGFEHPTTLNHLFRRVLGVTPTALRRLL